MTVIGVTGKIGAGKSTVAEFFKELGSKIIDADRISHFCLEDNVEEVKRKIREYEINLIEDIENLREQLSTIVFNDESALDTLCKILHPCIVERVEKKLTKIKNYEINSVVVIDCPLLFKMGLSHLTDYVVFVTASAEERVKRVIAERNLTKSNVIERSKRQNSLEDKKEEVDFVIFNTKGKAYIRGQVKEIWEELTHSS